MIRSIAAAAVLALAGFASAGSAGITAKSPYPPIEMKEGTRIPCNFTRIMIGPSGGEIAVWARERSNLLDRRTPPPLANILVGRMHDKGSGKTDVIRHYFGPDLTIPVRWSESGTILHARATNDRIVAIDAGSGRVEERGALDPAWEYVDVRAVTHGDLSVLEAPEMLAKAKRVGSDFYRGHLTLGTDSNFVGARTGDLVLVRVGQGRALPPVVSASYAHRIVGYPDDADFDGGVAYVGAEGKDGLRFLPYQLPLVDLATGMVAGKFNGRDIVLRREGALAAPLAEFRRRLGGGGIILDASLSGGALALLTKRGEEIWIRRLSTHGLTEKRLCTLRTGLPPHIAERFSVKPELARLRLFGLRRDGREAAAPGLPVASLYQGGPAPARDLVVMFPGGPTGNFSEPYDPATVLRLLSPGRDILVVGYAGSIGGGLALTRRLTDGGMRAIEEDVDAVVKWLDRQDYRRVFLDGGSFGGVPALVALSRYPKRFDAAFLSAPLLRLKDPEEWAASGAFGPTSPTGQRAFEAGIFGGPAGRARFAADLERLVARAPLRPVDRVFFARHDLISQPADLPPGKAAPTRVVSGTHALIGTHPDYLKEVLAIMQPPPRQLPARNPPSASRP